jgi:hypothetical protein
MIITPNMELNSWSSLGDFYNHLQLATNWSNIDLHDHSAGKGVKLTASLSIVAGSITTPLFAAGSVTSSVIGNQQVETINIANQAVGTAQLANGAVTNAQLSAAAVETVNIADNNITTAKMADNAVTLAKLAPGGTPWRFVVLSPAQSYSANNGDWVIAATGSTVTAPAPTDNATFAVVAQNAIGPVGFEVLAHSGEFFFGVGFTPSTTLLYTCENNGTIYQAAGGNWINIAGSWYDSGGVNLWSSPPSGLADGSIGYPPGYRFQGRNCTFYGSILVTGSYSNPVAVLPSAFRPAQDVAPVISVNESGTYHTAVLLIDTSGNVFIPASLPTGSAIGLDGVSFWSQITG